MATLQKIAKELDNTIFIRKDNIVTPQPGEKLAIKYTTGRGTFYLGIKEESTQKVIVLDTETTVEFIAEAVVNMYRDLLVDNNVIAVYVSEGLSKGAVATVGS
jgi:hypothetical protein